MVLVGSDKGELNGVVLSPSLQVSSRARKGLRETMLSTDALNSVERVHILDEDNLVACRTALARDNGRVSKEVLPDLRGGVSILTPRLDKVGMG